MPKSKKKEAGNKVISDDFNPWYVMEPRLMTLDTLNETRGEYIGLIAKVTFEKIWNKKAGYEDKKLHIYLEELDDDVGTGRLDYFYIPNKAAMEVLVPELSPDGQSVKTWIGAKIRVYTQNQEWHGEIQEMEKKMVEVLDYATYPEP